MTIDELLALAAARGIRFEVKDNGFLAVRFDRGSGWEDLTGQFGRLGREIRERSDEIAEHLRPKPKPTRRIVLVSGGKEEVVREFMPGRDYDALAEERAKHPGKELRMQALHDTQGFVRWLTFATVEAES